MITISSFCFSISAILAASLLSLWFCGDCDVSSRANCDGSSRAKCDESYLSSFDEMSLSRVTDRCSGAALNCCDASWLRDVCVTSDVGRGITFDCWLEPLFPAEGLRFSCKGQLLKKTPVDVTETPAVGRFVEACVCGVEPPANGCWYEARESCIWSKNLTQEV